MKPAAQAEVMEPRQLLSSSGLFIAATGELNLFLGSKDNVRVSSVAGSVLVETSEGTGSYSPLLSFGSVTSASVQSLVIVGGDDANTIDLTGVTAAAFTALTSISVDAANGHDSIIGSLDLADSIIGGHGNDTINGQGGHDSIIGGDGNDSIIGGVGNDSIIGGDGQDIITGDAGNDSIDAGNGNDTIAGGIDNDSISAGNGKDSLNGDSGNDTLNGDGGADTVSGDDDDDSILGGESGDSLLGGAGNDTINGQSGNDNIDGGDGDDSLKGGTHNDTITGGADNDVLNGEAGDDQLDGGDFNDSVFGGSGNDSLNGGLGNDVLSGQSGNDTLTGGGDADTLNGGAGNDFLISIAQSVSIVSAVTIATEGDSGTSNASFLVSLSHPSASTVTVDFATQDGTAIAGLDYQPVSGRLTFAPGVTSQNILVPIIGDTLDEVDEIFTVVLSNPGNVQLGQSTSTATITNDDAPPTSLFDIQIVFSGGLTLSQQAIFRAAELRWESIITGDVPDVVVPGFGLIDDVEIDASGIAIDGAGGILGQAGPDFLRPGSSLPAHGLMQFDTADLAALEASGQLQDTILHEMAHVLGFGTIWSNLGLLLNPASQGGNNPRFTGAQATQEFNARFGQNAADVPVEATGGQGTADGHWRDSVFNNELMTGFINTPGPNPLSRITIAQFADLGYQVNFTPADTYLVAPLSRRTSIGGLPRNDLIVTRPVQHVLPPSAVVKHPTLQAAGQLPALGVNSVDLTTGDTPANSTQWIVSLKPGSSPAQLAVSLGVLPLVATGHAADTYVLTLANASDSLELKRKLDLRSDVVLSYPLVARQQSKRAIPNDPLFSNEWHLLNVGQTGGTVGADANVTPVWDTYLGTGVVIGIIDDGLEHTHPDLVANYVASLSFDFNSNDPNPTPTTSFDDHGTAVAGVAAGVGFNGLGVSGAAPSASLAGLRLIAAPTTDLDEANALGFMTQGIDIYNNSWGPADTGADLVGPGPLTLAALQNGVTTGRGGLGNIYIWSAGNGLLANDNVNYDGYANSRFTLAVSAIDDRGRQSFYSEPGAPILVAAYSNGNTTGITTTDLSGNQGSAPGDYRNDFGGTSSAAPLVSGVVALMLEANPNLNYRDVQHILVNSSRQNDPTDSDWTTNGAGHLVNHKYGFGAIDANAAVSTALTWVSVGPEVSIAEPVINVGAAIPDNSLVGVTSTINVAQDINIEHVEVTFNATHSFRGDLEIILTSPSGTQSVLAERHDDSGNNFNNWVMTTVHNWDESSVGTWTLQVRDRAIGNVGTFNSWQVAFFGTVPMNPTPEPVGVDLAGDVMTGGEGDDTIIGASGNDTISGQAGNDSLLGDAGDDSILGGAGQDTLDGQAGNDTLDGQGSSDTVFGGDGDDTFNFNLNSSGFETIDGGEGLDTAQVNGTASADTIVVGATGSELTITAGVSTLIVTGRLQNVIIDGLGGDDTITVGNVNTVGFLQLAVRGGDGNDLLTAAGAEIGLVRLSLNGDNGNDTLLGSNGNDTLDGGAGNDVANGDAGNDTIRGGADSDQIGGGLGNDSIDSGDGDDTANGDAGNDSILGGNGNDNLEGADGDDTLDGGAGNDNLDGMAGDDLLLGDFGKDTLTGGAGNDTLDGGRNDDSIGGNAGDDLIRGDHGNDAIDAGDGNNTVNGGDGNDTILASDGIDLLNGGDGHDLINAGNGNDTITGGDGNDTLLGGSGNDVILGGDGDDSIKGQGGTDTIAGNQGLDVIFDPVDEINEKFVLSKALTLLLDAA